MTDAERDSLAVHDVRLTQVEREVRQMREAIEAGFGRMDGRLDRLAYVPVDLYRSEQGAQDKTIAAQNDKIGTALKAAYTAIMFSIIIGLAAVLALVGTIR